MYANYEKIDISDWNVRIIQNGVLVQDVLYNIYENLSIVFEENEGYFYHDDYQKALKETDRDYRSPLLPIRNHSISEHDYFSVSVSLEVYMKMLKGEKKLPNNISLEDRKNHSILFLSTATISKEIEELIEDFYKKL